jgi:hypothetical protein
VKLKQLFRLVAGINDNSRAFPYSFPEHYSMLLINQLGDIRRVAIGIIIKCDLGSSVYDFDYQHD